MRKLIHYPKGLILLLAMANSGLIFSQCPTISKTNPHWYTGTLVYYDLSGISDPQIKSQIEAAINYWNNANAANGSKIKFKPGASGGAVPWLYFQIGGSRGIDSAGIDNWHWVPDGAGGYALTDATIRFYTDGSLPNGSPLWNPNDKVKYYSYFLKLTLHEIGHLMGLNDVINNSSAGSSVMNIYSGTNDSGGNLPTNVTNCDNNTIKNSANSPYHSGGGGSGSSGNNPGCTPTYVQTYTYINDEPIPIGDPVYAGCL